MGCRKLSYYEGEGGEEKSPLRIFPCIEEKNDSSIFCIDYSPFGLTFNSYERTASTPNRYLFNGIERQEETGWDLAEFRAYDPTIARWLQVDPKASERESPYVGFGNNPLFYTDPLGDTVIVNGTAAFQATTLTNLQSLTNDKLAMDKNGVISITSSGTENSSSTLTEGTSLLQELGGTKNVTIVETTGGNTTTAKSGKDANVDASGKPGPGSDSTVKFNPTKTTGGVDVTGSTTRPTFIGLGHELLHSRNNARGTRDLSKATSITDPDTGKKGTLSQSELKTRKEENLLRKEQGLPLRKTPK
jgi:RHS repeat-associated protein